MADTKISALTAATSLTGTEEVPLNQSGTTKKVTVTNLFGTSNAKWSGWVYPYTTGWVGTAGQPLTSTSWDGDAFSTTAKTLIDLSVVFGAPAGIKAVLVSVYLRDSASAAGDYHLILGPTNTANKGIYVPCGGLANDKFAGSGATIPCDANGDIYYQITASGTGTMDIYLEIWGYCL